MTKGWTSMRVDRTLAASPANDHRLLTSAPTTQGPGVQTNDGGRAGAPLADAQRFLRRRSAASSVGPTPTIRSSWGSSGEEQRRVDVAEPDLRVSPFVSDGWWMIGTMVRVIRFQSSVSLNGITGWMLSTFWAAFVRAVVEVRVVLERHADQVGDRVLRLLLQRVGYHRAARPGRASRRERRRITMCWQSAQTAGEAQVQCTSAHPRVCKVHDFRGSPARGRPFVRAARIVTGSGASPSVRRPHLLAPAA